MMNFKKLMSKVWLFLKNRGWIIVVGVGLVIAAVFATGSIKARLQTKSLWELIRRENKLYKEQLVAIEDSYKQETVARESAAKTAIAAIKAAEASAAARGMELDAAKKNEISRIVHESIDDPERITKILAKQYGFHFEPSKK